MAKPITVSSARVVAQPMKDARRCCRCGKKLTNPVAVALGLDVDCYKSVVPRTRALFAAGLPPVVIARLVGAPLEFVYATIRDRFQPARGTA